MSAGFGRRRPMQSALILCLFRAAPRAVIIAAMVGTFCLLRGTLLLMMLVMLRGAIAIATRWRRPEHPRLEQRLEMR